MPSPVRVAILECDTPVDSVKEARGTYGDIFRDLLEAGLSAYQSDSSSSIEPTFTKWDVVTAREYPDLLDVDVILLSGSSRCPSTLDSDIQCLVAVTNGSQNTIASTTTRGYWSWWPGSDRFTSRRAGPWWAFALDTRSSHEEPAHRSRGAREAGRFPCVASS